MTNEPIPQEWVLRYAEQMIGASAKLSGDMAAVAKVRAQFAFDILAAWRDLRERDKSTSTVPASAGGSRDV